MVCAIVVAVDDVALVRRWQDGDQQAGQQLFARYYEPIYRFFCEKASDDVEELVQQTFVALLDGRERFAGRASFRSYLYGIARNTLFGYYRKRRRDARIEPSVTRLQDLAPSPSILLAQGIEERVLARALRAIPIDDQILLELHYWEALNSSELGEILGTPPPTIRTRMRRARDKLRNRMQEISGSPSEHSTSIGGIERWLSSLRPRLPPRTT